MTDRVKGWRRDSREKGGSVSYLLRNDHIGSRAGECQIAPDGRDERQNGPSEALWSIVQRLNRVYIVDMESCQLRKGGTPSVWCM